MKEERRKPHRLSSFLFFSLSFREGRSSQHLTKQEIAHLHCTKRSAVQVLQSMLAMTGNF
jgi:hypothetical protein